MNAVIVHSYNSSSFDLLLQMKGIWWFYKSNKQ